MLKSYGSYCVFIAVLIYFINVVKSGESESDKGLWNVMHVDQCPGHEAFPLQIEVVKKKVNRTHVGFIGHIDLDRDVLDSFSIRCDVCKHVDGGCKDFYVLSESSLCGFLEKFGKSNLETMISPYGRSLPLCPITKGKHELTELFIMDFGDLPEDGMYGVYDSACYVLAGPAELGCLKLTLEFEPKPEAEEEEDC